MQALTYHAGVSFNGGPAYVHLRAANADSRTLRAVWDEVVVRTGLGEALEVSRDAAGNVEASARLFPFATLTTISSALRSVYSGRALSRMVREELALAGMDAKMYNASYGMHVREAARRGWVVQPLKLGLMPAVMLGAGRHSHLLVMNLPPRVSSALTLAGINKAVARDLLVAHGLPVAAGRLASSPSAVLRIARDLGGAVVLKRITGGNSDGVIVGVRRPADVTSAARLLLNGAHAILVEAQIEGTELRLHYLSGKLHRTFLAVPFAVKGDGSLSLAELLAARYPQYLEHMSTSEFHRRRLVMCLWGAGVRKVEDLERIIPEKGRVLRVSAATGASMQQVDPLDFMPARDLTRIESFLASHGAPSCGIDIIVGSKSESLDQTGAILELNCPCGFGYLDDPQGAVAADLEAAIGADDTFARDKGRIPVWLVMTDDAGDVARRAKSKLEEAHANVAVALLEENRSNWISMLNQPSADAMLIHVSETGIRAHGMPVNLAPTLIHAGTRNAFVKKNPITCATLRHARGRLTSLERTYNASAN